MYVWFIRNASGSNIPRWLAVSLLIGITVLLTSLLTPLLCQSMTFEAKQTYLNKAVGNCSFQVKSECGTHGTCNSCKEDMNINCLIAVIIYSCFSPVKGWWANTDTAVCSVRCEMWHSDGRYPILHIVCWSKCRLSMQSESSLRVQEQTILEYNNWTALTLHILPSSSHLMQSGKWERFTSLIRFMFNWIFTFPACVAPCL